jgi:transcription termination/antitermination protein NusG
VLKKEINKMIKMKNTVEKAMKWYIVRSQSNREKSVSEKIIKESEKGDLLGKLGRILVPSEKSFYVKDGKKITRDKVLYPGYIFVECNAIGELKYFVKGCNGAQGFLTDRAGEIQSLKDYEVERMLGLQKESEEKQELGPVYMIGQEVKILDGPFSSFTGSVESLDTDKVKVAVMIFGRKTLVELKIQQIDKNLD